jgi:hypothetical protein
MAWNSMSPREKLQAAYELAFYPPRLNRAWNDIKRQHVANLAELSELLDMALRLHQALPEEGVASPGALKRLALYQARARTFGMVRFLRNIRAAIGLPATIAESVVPAWMVRDIGLPPFCRSSASHIREHNTDYRTEAKGAAN